MPIRVEAGVVVLLIVPRRRLVRELVKIVYFFLLDAVVVQILAETVVKNNRLAVLAVLGNPVDDLELEGGPT